MGVHYVGLVHYSFVSSLEGEIPSLKVITCKNLTTIKFYSNVALGNTKVLEYIRFK